jgi:hypothetical protein
MRVAASDAACDSVLPPVLAAEEMWQVLGHSVSLAYETWPEADESLLVQTTYNLPVQVRAQRAGDPAVLPCWLKRVRAARGCQAA